MPLSVSFTTTSDGVRIAYIASGKGPPLLFVRGWITHLELMWGERTFRRFFEALEQRFRVVRYDARGNGLSQRDVGQPELAEFVLDVDAVVGALGLESIVLWGSCFGGPVAIAYAAQHPELVSRLVLEGTFPTWKDARTPGQRRSASDLVHMLKNSPAMATAAASYMTDPEPESRHEDRAQRLMSSVDAEYLAYLYVLATRMDVHAAVGTLALPTLVLHARESQVYPPEGARLLAAAIPGAQYVELPGRHHNPWEGDANAALAALTSFCAVAPISVPTATSDRVTVVMFTDIVASTDVADRLGDDAARTLRRAHEQIVVDSVAEHRGRIVKFLGDGALAQFSTASSALNAAADIVAAARAHNVDGPATTLLVRVGLNAGESIEEDGDIHGVVVNLAARVCAAANGNDVLVTGAVRHLATGKGFTFEDRGFARLKGFADEMQLYELNV